MDTPRLIPPGFIEVHDSETVHKRKNPEGNRMRVRAASIDAIRPYSDGECTLTIHGSYLHVTESADTVAALIKGTL